MGDLNGVTILMREFYWGTSKSQHFEWGVCGFLVIFNGVIFSYKYSSGVSDFSNGVKKWAIFGNIFHWGDEWGGSHWVTEAGVYEELYRNKILQIALCMF